MYVVNILKSSYLNYMYMHMEIKTCSLYRSFEIYFLISFFKNATANQERSTSEYTLNHSLSTTLMYFYRYEKQ